MPDREKVIRAWEIFRNSNPYQICDGKEFRAIKESEYCMGQMIEDTITLLKAQEVKTGHWIIVEYDTLTCSCCGESYYTGCDSTKEATANLEKGNVYRYCPYCGAKMQEDGEVV